MSRHRGAPVRPRYGRLAAFSSSLAVTLIAVLGGTGVLPSAIGGDDPRSGDVADTAVAPGADAAPAGESTVEQIGEPLETGEADVRAVGERKAKSQPVDETALPADSGEGRRVVFSQSRQRVWLVGAAGRVQSTYLVSGSLTDNLDPGTYSVYSRSEQAWGIDDSGTMKYFVRFAQGERAAIGFHDIPIDEGKPVQTLDQLGTPQSHGCIRQKRSDAIRLWNFAPLGTTVVVTA